MGFIKFEELNKPRVLNKKNYYSDNFVYIERPSKWGNPFSIGKDGTREEVILRYREYLLSNKQLVAEAKIELKGKDLVCWCSPLPCHGDILLEIANEE